MFELMISSTKFETGSHVVTRPNRRKTLLTPASMAQLDARQSGDQEVADSNHAGSATFFHGDWSRNIFCGYCLPSADSKRAVVSFWRKNVQNTG